MAKKKRYKYSTGSISGDAKLRRKIRASGDPISVKQSEYIVMLVKKLGDEKKARVILDYAFAISTDKGWRRGERIEEAVKRISKQAANEVIRDLQLAIKHWK